MLRREAGRSLSLTASHTCSAGGGGRTPSVCSHWPVENQPSGCAPASPLCCFACQLRAHLAASSQGHLVRETREYWSLKWHSMVSVVHSMGVRAVSNVVSLQLLHMLYSGALHRSSSRGLTAVVARHRAKTKNRPSRTVQADTCTWRP